MEPEVFISISLFVLGMLVFYGIWYKGKLDDEEEKAEKNNLKKRR